MNFECAVAVGMLDAKSVSSFKLNSKYEAAYLTVMGDCHVG